MGFRPFSINKHKLFSEAKLKCADDNIYTSQNLIRATQCKFPLQNIQFTCKT